eukprot:g29168.t1
MQGDRVAEKRPKPSSEMDHKFATTCGARASHPLVPRSCRERAVDAVFWTLPGEWSTFIGTSDQHTVSLTLSAMPSRCYVQKECCADEFFLCRLVHVTRADVPGGWGQRLSLECVQPALSAISLRPQLQDRAHLVGRAIGPESLLLAPRDNQSVTVVHPLRLAGGLAGCECAEILVELAVEGSETWIPQSACNDWTLRECVVEPLEAGTTYEGRVRIQSPVSSPARTSLDRSWLSQPVPGATVTTNLEALVVEGSLTVTVGSGRRLGRRLAQLELQKVLSEVTALELRSILVTPLGGSDLGYILAAASIGRELDEASAQAAAEEAQRHTIHRGRRGLGVEWSGDPTVHFSTKSVILRSSGPGVSF